MPKVTVYVPDELWKRSQALGEAINLSQVFQTALRAEMRQHEVHRHEQTDLDATINLDALRRRFTKERAALYRRGYEIGVRRAQSLSYADLRFCANVDWDTSAVLKHLSGGGPLDELAHQDLAEPATGLPDPRLWPDGLGSSTWEGAVAEMGEGFVDALRRVWELVAEEHADVA